MRWVCLELWCSSLCAGAMGWPAVVLSACAPAQTNGANCECSGRVWRMDVGMSKGVLDAPPQVFCRAPRAKLE